MTDLVTYEREDRVARIRMDDGKANIMSTAMLSALHTAFDRAAADQAVAVFTGRTGVFSAGFDLKVLRGGTATEFFAMLRLGAELALKVLSMPTPVITVVEGHAYPMGAFLVLASDVRVGTSGDWRIGLNEVQIGIPVPRFAVEVARQRLAPAWFNRTVALGEMFAPDDAQTAGFIDIVVAPADLASAVVKVLEGVLSAHPSSHSLSKSRARAPAIAAIRAAIDEDITLAYAELVMRRRVG